MSKKEKRQPRKPFWDHPRFINALYYIAMAALLFWYAYSKGWIFADFPKVTPKEALQMLQNDTNTTLLDVRTPQEFHQGHLRGATLIPLDKLEENLDKLASKREKKILVYCRSGSRSIAASRILKAHGYHPIDIEEGIIGLYKAGATLVR